MATFVSGDIKELSDVKDNIKLRVRILRTWMQPVYWKPHIINMEMIVMEEHAKYKGAGNTKNGFGEWI